MNEEGKGGGDRDTVDKVAEVIGTVDRHHDGKGSAAARVLLDSFHRICRAGEDMIARDELWKSEGAEGGERFTDAVLDSAAESGERYRRWRKPEQDETEADTGSPHPLGAVAEFLVAKTIASFGGEKAVKELGRWTRDTESRLTAGRGAEDDQV